VSYNGYQKPLQMLVPSWIWDTKRASNTEILQAKVLSDQDKGLRPNNINTQIIEDQISYNPR